jgi:hypothetical protein
MSTAPRPVVTGATVEQIEQSIARGDRPQFTAEQLRIPIRQVLDVRAALDAINNEPDAAAPRLCVGCAVPLVPHGRQPPPGWRVHHARGMCRRCQPRALGGWDLKPCGTPAAYKRHWRRSEPPCVACVAAHRRERAEYRARRRVA